ncbi:MAG: response regulator, partial [Limisphaerales bacterium]
QVIEATNGAEAVAVYAQHSEQIALVVTDIMMPIMDGVALVRALRAINPEVKMLGASGFVGDQSGSNRMAELQAAGVSLVIEKPFAAETLLRAVADQLAT